MSDKKMVAQESTIRASLQAAMDAEFPSAARKQISLTKSEWNKDRAECMDKLSQLLEA